MQFLIVDGKTKRAIVIEGKHPGACPFCHFLLDDVLFARLDDFRRSELPIICPCSIKRVLHRPGIFRPMIYLVPRCRYLSKVGVPHIRKYQQHFYQDFFVLFWPSNIATLSSRSLWSRLSSYSVTWACSLICWSRSSFSLK